MCILIHNYVYKADVSSICPSQTSGSILHRIVTLTVAGTTIICGIYTKTSGIIMGLTGISLLSGGILVIPPPSLLEHILPSHHSTPE